MKIIEQDEQHLAIGPTITERLGWIYGFVFSIVWLISVQYISDTLLIRILFSVVGLVLLYYSLRGIIGKRVVIDKLTQTVKIKERSVFLVGRHRIIPFSGITNIEIAYDRVGSGAAGSRDTWRVFLNVGGYMVGIDHTLNRTDMQNIATEISRYIGKELVDNSEKPESLSTRFFRKTKSFFRKDGNLPSD